MIEIRHLRKEYGDTIALENLHLQIPAGEVFGLIGPNGAGKTTLIRVLATLLEPTYGHVTIDGIDVLENPLKVHPLIGYMSDFFSLYDELMVWEYLDHFALCYGVPRKKRQALLDNVLELVSLRSRRDSPITSLSRGMRQRLCFAKTLLHEPKVLLLDEPASGLDPAGRVEFRDMLNQLKAMGSTVVISSHILTEMTEFCTSIGILEQGTLRAAGRVDDILEQMQACLQLELEILDGADRAIALLEANGEVRQISTDGPRITCQFTGAREQLPALHKQMVTADIPIVTFAARTDNLEEIYMKISGHQVS